MEQPGPDQWAARLAARQLGLINRAQALGLGLTVHQIARRLDSGRWLRLRRGVYVIAGSPRTPEQLILGACFAGPERTVVSHLSAAYLFGLRPLPDRLHLTVPRGTSPRMPDVEVHRADLARLDRTAVGVVPVTHPARMLVDSASLLEPRPMTQLLDDTLSRGLTRPALVDRAVSRASLRPGRRGLPVIAEALKAWTDGIMPGSPAEMRLLRRLGEWGFPQPLRQYEVRMPSGAFLARLDLAWPALLIGLEYDGQGTHTPRDLLQDEIRHTSIVAAGWDVLRVDKRDLRPSADRLRRELATAFDRRQIA